MPDAVHLLAIDQGTTSTRGMVFDAAGRALATARRELTQHHPRDGWVEHDPEEIWRHALETAREAIAAAGVPIRAVGIANQRETTVLWDRASGAPVHPAIVWQDRRTAAACARLRAEGAEELVRARTGLLLDPYFSATKLAWMLEHVPGLRSRAERGELAFGTIDSFLLWRLTGGRVHATDATNASRTLLFDIHRQCWDDELLRLFGIPAALLPAVRDSAGPFGETTLLGGHLPITGIAGDQQAAMVGQGCLTPGTVKATYGTGCFALLHTGERSVPSSNRLLSTVACRIAGQTTHALEGAIFVAGAAVGWLRDGLGVIAHPSDTAHIAASVPGNRGVYVVPAFVGLGAPHWAPEARGLVCGLTLDATAAHVVRATLEAVAYQTLDLVEAMARDGADPVRALRVDGGMSANDWLCQFLADVLGVPVHRPAMPESTALGAALLAGLGSNLFTDLAEGAARRPPGQVFTPAMPKDQRDALVAGWRRAVRLALMADAPEGRQESSFSEEKEAKRLLP